jgi:hypothetical protein
MGWKRIPTKITKSETHREPKILKSNTVLVVTRDFVIY